MESESALRHAGNASPDTARSALLLVIVVSFVCALVVTGTTVLLAPIQERRRAATPAMVPVLAVAGVYDPESGEAPPGGRVRARLIDLATGAYVEGPDPETFDPRRAARDPDQSVPVPEGQDLANIGRRARYGPVFLVDAGEAGARIVIPVFGPGAYSELAGYLALENDARAAYGIDFYEQGETPGLGAQIADPAWQARWRGVRLFDPAGSVRIVVARGPAQAEYEVDGISGATLTGRAVTAIVRYWLGEHGYGPYLRLVQQGERP